MQSSLSNFSAEIASTDQIMVNCELHLLSQDICNLFSLPKSSVAYIDFVTEATSLDALAITLTTVLIWKAHPLQLVEVY